MTDDFARLEEKFPFLKHARERFWGLRGLNCAIIDIETTGLEPEPNEIIEVAALKLEQGSGAGFFTSLIRIDRPLPPEIVALTGITDELLAGGGDKTEVFRQLLDYIKDIPLIAHNADFDRPFLDHHLGKTLGVKLANPQICTLKLSRKIIPGLQSYRLQKLAEYFAIPTPVVHRAHGDVEITSKLWLELVGLLEKRGITTLENLLNF